MINVSRVCTTSICVSLKVPVYLIICNEHELRHSLQWPEISSCLTAFDLPFLFVLILSGILSSAQASLDDAVTLKECDSVDLTRISSPNDYIAAASSSETLEQIEAVVTAWVKQIEQVHIQVTCDHDNILFSHEVLLFSLEGSLGEVDAFL